MFTLASTYKPKGDQPHAIEKLSRNLREGLPFQTLLGVTGSGKTYTMASVIAEADRPVLIISHNKTLAAQLYQEFKEFFPENAVHYFVSYYDYYQPEAYIPHTDTYIEKDAAINEVIDKLRHAATQSILSRRDVIVIASVSCIYGIGEPAEYERASLALSKGERIPRKDALRKLTRLQYARNDYAKIPGTFSVKGETVEVRPMTGMETILLEWNGNMIESITVADTGLKGAAGKPQDAVRLFPAKHFMTPEDTLGAAMENIRMELKERLAELAQQQKLLEAQRLSQRTKYDLEMLKETGYCTGIENYSRHLDFRKPGEPPKTLLDFYEHAYKNSWLLFVDESHMTVPQFRGMYNGDRARKNTLVEYGFRLPSAIDNRPLRFDEFLRKIPQTIFVSATPNAWELSMSGSGSALAESGAASRSPKNGIVEQLIRPTGLLDPTVEVVPTTGQIPRLEREILLRVKRKERTLVVTLTKRLAEELTEYLKEKYIKVQYLHSDVKTMERPEILENLRKGTYDVVVGINLLREGLDLPEVSLVAILDADKEGFLRNATTLIQTIGRAARHAKGHVMLFADTQTESMKTAIEETARRRTMQERYNTAHGITPKTIIKDIKSWTFGAPKDIVDPLQMFMKELLERKGFDDLPAVIQSLTKEMGAAAKELDFEKAALIRDQIAALKKRR